MRVLLLEDSQAFIKLFRELCEAKEDCELEHASSLQKARELAQKEFDIAFIDVVVEDGIALDFAKELAKKTRVYIISAFDEKYLLNFIKDEVIIEKDEHFLEKILDLLQEDDGFLDFSDIDEDEIMQELNKSHQTISAHEFLDKYGVTREDIEEIEEKLGVIEGVSSKVLAERWGDILELFDLLIALIYDKEELDKLADILVEFRNFFEQKNLDDIPFDKEELFVGYLKSVVADIEDWIEHIFVTQDARDVSYINASLYNALLEIKRIVDGS